MVGWFLKSKQPNLFQQSQNLFANPFINPHQKSSMDPFYMMFGAIKRHMAWPCQCLSDVENILLCQGIFFHVSKIYQRVYFLTWMKFIEIFHPTHGIMLTTHEQCSSFTLARSWDNIPFNLWLFSHINKCVFLAFNM
jgi:hypothetical protein